MADIPTRRIARNTRRAQRIESKRTQCCRRALRQRPAFELRPCRTHARVRSAYAPVVAPSMPWRCCWSSAARACAACAETPAWAARAAASRSPRARGGCSRRRCIPSHRAGFSVVRDRSDRACQGSERAADLQSPAASRVWTSGVQEWIRPTHRCLRAVRVPNILAAGDLVDLPVEQGGLATQLPDIVAPAGHTSGSRVDRPAPLASCAVCWAPMARSFGARSSKWWPPVATEGRLEFSKEGLWWPPAKVFGRYSRHGWPPRELTCGGLS